MMCIITISEQQTSLGLEIYFMSENLQHFPNNQVIKDKNKPIIAILKKQQNLNLEVENEVNTLKEKKKREIWTLTT